MKNAFLSILTSGLFLGLIINSIAQIPTKKSITENQKKWGMPPGADAIKNPYLNNAVVTESGKKQYNTFCVSCHGEKGKGNGVAASALDTRPADHSSPSVQLQTDGALYWEITNGKSPMPSYKTLMTDEQRWACVNYIRTLAK
jgi:mono/diheme cytochrome c family protein